MTDEEEEVEEEEEEEETGSDRSEGELPHDHRQTLLHHLGPLTYHDVKHLRFRDTSVSVTDEYRIREIVSIVSLSFPDESQMSVTETGPDGDTILLSKLIKMNTTVDTFCFVLPIYEI